MHRSEGLVDKDYSVSSFGSDVDHYYMMIQSLLCDVEVNISTEHFEPWQSLTNPLLGFLGGTRNKNKS